MQRDGLIKDIVFVKSDIRIYIDNMRNREERISWDFDKKNKKPEFNSPYSYKTGLFRVMMNDDSFIMVVCWYTPVTRGQQFMGAVIGTEDDIRRFRSLTIKQKERQAKPKPGIYLIKDFGQGIIHYEQYEKAKLPHGNVIHPVMKGIMDHIEFYFANVKKFMVNNRSGRKTVLWYGPTGTGKTSIALEVAQKYADKFCIVFVTAMDMAYRHVGICAKHKVPTIIIYEDCEGWLSLNNAEVKNFLSGIDQKPNPAGCYVIMTTNYPARIEQTIVKRKGRIDRLIHIGKLDNGSLQDCVMLYFKKYCSDNELTKIISIFVNKKYSGSEIETMADESLTIAASEGRKHIILEDVKQIIVTFGEEFAKMQEVIIETKLNDFDAEEQKGIGFQLPGNKPAQAQPQEVKMY
jgi:hypothetical protein